MVSDLVAGRYEFLEPAGNTQKATDHLLGRSVAIGTIPESEAPAQEVLEACLRLRHPGIALLYQHFVLDGECYFVTEVVEGHSLQETIESGVPMAEDQAVALLSQIAEALRAAQAAGVFCGRLDAAQVMVSAGNRIKIGNIALRASGSGVPGEVPAGLTEIAERLLDRSLPEATAPGIDGFLDQLTRLDAKPDPRPLKPQQSTAVEAKPEAPSKGFLDRLKRTDRREFIALGGTVGGLVVGFVISLLGDPGKETSPFHRFMRGVGDSLPQKRKKKQAAEKSLNSNSVAGVVDALKSGALTDEELVDAVKKNGIAVDMTAENEAKLRAAGASDQLIEALRANAAAKANHPNKKSNETPEQLAEKVSDPGIYRNRSGAWTVFNDEQVAWSKSSQSFRGVITGPHSPNIVSINEKLLLAMDGDFTADDYVLAQLKPVHGDRQFEIGGPKETVINFTATRTKSGKYFVTADMDPGEYALLIPRFTGSRRSGSPVVGPTYTFRVVE